MTINVRRSITRSIAAVTTLGTALVGCGAGAAGKDPVARPAKPPSATATAQRPAGPEHPALMPVFLRGPEPAGATGREARTGTRTGTGTEEIRAGARSGAETGTRAGAGGKTVALTFDADMTPDQGPGAARGERFDNPALISSLRRLEVPATVFMTGRWAEEYPYQAREIGSDPLFEVANHSYSHHSFTPDCHGLPVLARKELAADVRRAFGAFRKAGVRQVVPYFRFPGGCYDTSTLRALAPAGLTAVQWDVVSGDAFATDAEAVAERVLAEVRPGSVVVMHCTTGAAPVTDEAVRAIVPALRARGYRFVKVSELMKG
ncbi:polysaccharide deacetylase family protein [Streptomyces sp. NBC_01498]|uniref:polysaccharide deacetylase family protein n=1 Tax=Streptomyces sp. NBC_01498 TaxID=2975870 RepID=UPI002E7C180B|nr:polysaccharide deacetylase family protein [Streptomyces sp. NBC_01498]WTL28686.1 polysaccharide deacetylase family protein [Streptomyces sp. NBC_01498]